MPHRISSMTKRTSRAILVVAILSAAAPLAMGQTRRPCPGPLFDNPDYMVGARPFAIASADLDGDGDGDLVTATYIDATISVLLNRGHDCVENPGDLDGDGSVGPFDLAILLGNWGPCANCDNCPADLDDDCNVGPADLAILLGHWG